MIILQELKLKSMERHDWFEGRKAAIGSTVKDAISQAGEKGSLPHHPVLPVSLLCSRHVSRVPFLANSELPLQIMYPKNNKFRQ